MSQRVGERQVPAPVPPDDPDAWYAPDVCTQDEVHPGVVATIRERPSGRERRALSAVARTSTARRPARSERPAEKAWGVSNLRSPPRFPAGAEGTFTLARNGELARRMPGMVGRERRGGSANEVSGTPVSLLTGRRHAASGAGRHVSPSKRCFEFFARWNYSLVLYSLEFERKSSQHRFLNARQREGWTRLTKGSAEELR